MRARDNPFRTDRVLTVRYRFVDPIDWPVLLRRLDEFDYRASIVGPEGAGKTTLQEDLAARLQSRGRTVRWLRLNRENRHTALQQINSLFVEASPDDFLFVDGAEQLGPLRWRRFVSRSTSYAGLLITTHVPGRLPTLHDCRTTPLLLHEIVGQLTSPEDFPPTELLDDLFRRHNGNLRLCLRALYDQWATTSSLSPAGERECAAASGPNAG